MRWRVPSTTPTLQSQRAKPSPSWSRLCPGIRIGRGLARIAQILWGKAPCGAGIACPPPRTPRRGVTRGGGSGGSDPLIFGAGAPPGRGRWCTPKSTTSPPRFGVAPSTVVPGGKAIESCRGQDRSTDRSCPSTPAGQVAGPVIQEPAPTLEQVRAPVGRLDLIADLVRQRSLRHLARMIGFLGRPVPKARPEAVRHRRDVQLPEQFRHRRVRDRLAPYARKHERTVARERPRLLQDLQGATAQRDPVLAILLRARGRDAPHTLVTVASRAIEASVMGEGEGSGGGDGGAGGELSPVGGSKGPEPLASPNVLHWVGWLPGTTRCGAGPAVPASHGHRALLRPSALGSGRPGSRPSHP